MIWLLAALAAFWMAYSGYLLVRLKKARRECAERNRQKLAAYSLLDRIGQSLTTTLEMDPALRIVADFAIHAIEAESGAVFLIDDSRGHLHARVYSGLFPVADGEADREAASEGRARRMEVGQGIIGGVAATGKPIRDAERSIMAVPLIARGVILGVLAVRNKRAGQPFSEEDMQLLQTLADQAALAVDLVRLAEEVEERHRIRQELKMAHDFQLMLLPKSCPKMEGLDIAAYCRPALEVGGDFYDFIPLSDDRLGVVIADASGKGIRGALLMASARSALRSEARRSDSPRDVLRRVNEQLRLDTSTSVFITMIYGVLDGRSRTFRFARAGHEPLLMLNGPDRELSVLSPDGMALGMVEADLFDDLEEQTITLNAGQALMLYTDGVVEAIDASGDEYGHRRFHDVLRSTAMLSCSDRVVRLVDDLGDFVRTGPQHDDITLVALGAKP